tara:strand:- start:541 stop:1161 length:621 start_codon:yes stop_codon:yes gene_type:complete
MSEIVYLLVNPVFPDLIKIGKTTNLEKRMRDLSSPSGVPVPFECYFACEVENAAEVEKRLHFGFGDRRKNPKREFFSINPERAKAILEGWSLKDVTPASDIVEDDEDVETLKRARARKPMFRFSMVEISVGAELCFIRDEAITCRVSSDREVEFDGVVQSLSQVTLGLLSKRFGKNWMSVRGPDFWLYEDETLTERRMRLEAEQPE